MTNIFQMGSNQQPVLVLNGIYLENIVYHFFRQLWPFLGGIVFQILGEEGASFVHAVRGLICTRGQGTRLYTRNGFAVCTTLFLQLCNLCAPCVQVVLYRSLAVVLRVKSNGNWFCSAR